MIVMAVKNVAFKTPQQLVCLSDARQVEVAMRPRLEDDFTTRVSEGLHQSRFIGHPRPHQVISPTLLVAPSDNREKSSEFRVPCLWTASPVMSDRYCASHK